MECFYGGNPGYSTKFSNVSILILMEFSVFPKSNEIEF